MADRQEVDSYSHSRQDNQRSQKNAKEISKYYLVFPGRRKLLYVELNREDKRRLNLMSYWNRTEFLGRVGSIGMLNAHLQEPSANKERC